jgi:hypothetical protein
VREYKGTKKYVKNAMLEPKIKEFDSEREREREREREIKSIIKP